jgi:hypothetical protein
MALQPEQPRPPSAWSKTKQYGFGIGLAAVLTLYGLYALIVGHAYLPGVRGGTATVGGLHGRGVAAAYLVGGLFLFFRFFLEKHVRRQFNRDQVYFIQNLLLIILIASLVYVLLNVGTAG